MAAIASYPELSKICPFSIDCIDDLASQFLAIEHPIDVAGG